jgi:hypothetical protein
MLYIIIVFIECLTRIIRWIYVLTHFDTILHKLGNG